MTIKYKNGKISFITLTPWTDVIFYSTVYILWIYWFIFSLVTPVTLWDSNAYNISRLELMLKEGLFRNSLFNDVRQEYVTWTFDAVHLPFRVLKFGESLPSFACLTGILLITFKLVSNYYSKTCAILSCAALLSMPCLMYQASSTKPDIAVIFCIFTWFYALMLYRKSGFDRYIYLMALSLGFSSGSKATGLLLVPFAGIYTLYLLRSQKIVIYKILLSSIVCFILWGSVEIYANNLIHFGHLMQPSGNPSDSRNFDGFSGALANFIRYIFSNTSTGLESYFTSFYQITQIWESLCRQILHYLHITDKGIQVAWTLKLDDNSMHFLKTGSETCSDYGPVGSLAIWVSIVYILKNRLTIDVKYILILVTFLALFLFSYVIGWGLWANRYLLFIFVPLTILVSIIIQDAKSKIISNYFRICVIISSVLTILCSFNKTPADMINCITNRESYRLKENVSITPIINQMHQVIQKDRFVNVAISAGDDAWILPFYDIENLRMVPLPLNKYKNGIPNKDRLDYVLFLQTEPPDNITKNITLMCSFIGTGGFWGRNSYLYKIK